MPSLAGQARKDGENSIPAASQMAFTAFAAPSFVANELPVNENYERKKELKKLGTVKSEVISEYMWKVIKIAFFNKLQAKKLPPKKFQHSLTICLRDVIASVVTKFEAFPTKTHKILRGIRFWFPWCCCENPPKFWEKLVNTWRNSIASR